MYCTSTSVLIICSLLIQKVKCFFLVTVGSHEKYQGVIFQMQSNMLGIFFPGNFFLFRNYLKSYSIIVKELVYQ